MVHQGHGENTMTDFALTVSTLFYICFTIAAYRHTDGRMFPALFAGFVQCTLVCSFMHIGSYTDIMTLGSFLVLGSILASVLAIDMESKEVFSKGNSVLVNRETLENLPMTMRRARQIAFRVIPQSQAA